MAYNKSEKLRDNIAAIRTAFDIERSGREATEQEKAVLRKYSGFGGLKFILNPCADDGDIEKWSRSDRPFFAATRELYGVLSDYARDGYEYRDFVRSIRNSILSAFYTPVPVVQAIAGVLKDKGLDVKRYLDPSAGKGTFVEAFKQAYPDVSATAFEKDLITGKVLKALYPHDQVHVDGFETIDASRRGTYDVVSSNIPFGDISVFDDSFARSGNAVRAAATKTIHNYFFLKALDQLREGGFVVFITSRGFMDSPSNNAIREEIIRNARLVGAFRLPDGLFADEAGTEVGSDLVILQKYTGYDSSLDPYSLAFCEVEKGFKAMSGEDYSDISLNVHWWQSMMAPDSEAFISTRMERGTDPYGKPTLVFTHDGDMQAIASLLTQYMSRDLYREYVDYYKLHAPKLRQEEQVTVLSQPKPQQPRPVQQEQPVQLSLFDLWAEELTSQEEQPSMEPRPFAGDILPHYRNGILVEDGGQIGHLTGVGYENTFTPTELSDDQSGRLRLYVKVRDAYEQLYKEESEQKVELPLLREELNRHYDNFLIRYGFLNDRRNARLLLMDVQGRDVLSLENSEDGRFVKSDIFLRPVSFNVHQDGHVETAVDALSASLNRGGGVDLEYMASISDYTEEELRDQLKERIYFNPLAGGYEIGDKFLAGNVVEKLDALRSWPLNDDLKPEFKEELERSITALEGVVPTPITYSELDFNFGERWMPKAYFSEFATEFFETDIKIDYAPQLDEFVVDVSGYSAKLSQEFAVTGETKTYDGEDMLRHALYNTVPVIQKCVGYKPNGDPIMGPDHEKIQLAASKVDQIRDGFTEWIDRHPDEWKKALANLYNRKYNCFVKASYDGSHQTFPGLDLKGLAVSKYQIKDIYKSQKDCVWMLLQNGGGVCDHEVGTGKTLTMCIAAHEMKRLGLAHKPIIIGMKANVAEIAATYQAAYPGDRLLYATQKDFSDRLNFFNRMKNNDYDCIIMSHDQFTMIPQSADIQQKVIHEEIDAIDEALEVYARQGHSVSGRMRSGLEKRKQNLETQLLTLNAALASRADDVVDFKTMGIDHIFIDESQAFKNLAFTTRDSRVAGLGDPKGSQRARILQYAIRTIQERTGRDLGATFLSGTTISNSLTELYLLFKYLRPKAMSMQDINSFDAWAAVFARKSRDYEINVAGSIVMKERFRQFIKVPELGAFYNEITDYKTAADVGLQRPDMDVQLVNIQPTEDQQDFQQRLLQFAESGDGDLVFRAPLNDNEEKAKMLIVTNLGKKCSLSPRLVNPGYREGDGTKIGVAARNISEIYYQYNEQRGTQFVFCDLSTPKKGEWSVYQELKDRLVNEHHIPADQIQFIQDAGTEKKKKEFIDRMNRGDIRVMIGSTTMLGTGVNAQQRAVAVHHLDLPWRPSDMEQRNGRARRKGNEVARDYAGNTVKCFVYAVERSLDSYNFYLLQAKSEFIRQMKTGALAKRSFDQGGEDEDNGMPFAEYVAITSGNNDLLERAKLEKRILGLEAERKAFYKQQLVTQQRLNFSREQVAHFDAVIGKLNADKNALEQALRGAYPDGSDVFEELRMPPSVLAFRPVEDPQLHRVRLDMSLPNPYGDYLQQAARQEVSGEVVVARLTVDGLDWPVAMSSKTEYNPNTGVSHWVGNKVSVIGGSGLHYTYNNGKVSLSDKALASRYPLEALSRIPEIIRDQQRQQESYAKQVPELERIAGKVWEKTGQLKELKEQLQALDRKIQQDMDGRVAQAAQAAKPEELPFTITHKQWGRDPWELQFKVADYPFLNHADRDGMAEKYHGYFRIYDGTVTGNFRHQFGAEEAMKELSKLNIEHKDDMEWLKAAVKDVRDASCIPSVHRLRELGYDRFGRSLTGDNARSLRAVSLGPYQDERVRALAHGVKDGHGVALDVAAAAMAKALEGTPVSKNAVLVGMPGHKGYGGSAQRLAKRLSELSGIPYADALASGEHESLYEWKKEHPGEELPELFFTEDERTPVPKGRTPIIIDNVIDTGHTAWAAVEALEAEPVLFTVGSTGHEDSEGHDIRLSVLPKGVDLIVDAMPEGVGLTGLSQEEFEALLKKAQADADPEARRDLRRRGVDWYTGQPAYLVAHIVDKYEKVFSNEIEGPVRELTDKGASAQIFLEEELRHLTDSEKTSFDALIEKVKDNPKSGYSYQQLYDKRRLLVVHDYLKEKAARAIEQEALRKEQGTLRYDVANNQWSGIPSDVTVYCIGEPDRIHEVYGYTPNNDIDLVYFKAETEEASFAFVRVWVDDHQAETPAQLVIRLEKEGYDVGLHGERGRYVDFDTWDEAVQFEQHVRDIEREVHAPKAASERVQSDARINSAERGQARPKVKAEVKELESPIMRQFHDLKAKHPDALLLFRVGDFYETYENDAVEASRILGITLTHRHPTASFRSPKEAMAGFPFHALDTFLPKLIRAGKRVAICDQLEAPKATAKRSVTEMVQPGLRPRLQMVESVEDMKNVLPRDALLRDALIERMREAGIRVNTDVAAAERVLAQETVRQHARAAAPVFVSNARRAVERILQDKATPDQWLRMIERAGGIKAGEDRWMGLSLWLMDSKERTLTKRQVLEFIDDHQIRVEEVRYREPSPVTDSLRLDMMNEEFWELMADGEEATGSLYVDDHARWAWDRLVERYGDEFRKNTQFENDPVKGWHLKPFEWYEGKGPSAKAADYYGIDRTINDTRLEYTTGGLENKREIALVVPGIESWRDTDDVHFGDAGDGRAVAWVRFGDAVSQQERSEEEIQAIIQSMPSADQWKEVNYFHAVPGYRNFYNLNRNSVSYADCILEKDGQYSILLSQESTKSLMDGERNVAAAKRVGSTFSSLADAVDAYNEYVARRNRFIEEKTLVIDEIQSQRHQEGRERGYNPNVDIRGYAVQTDEDGNYLVTHPDGVSEDGLERIASRTIRFYDAGSPERAILLAARLDQNIYPSSRVPAAPFEKNWHELAMKRMLRYAAENGYDRVAWTTGNQQAERYSLGEHIDFVSAEPYEAQLPSESSGFDVTLHTRGMATVDLFVTRDGIIQSGYYGDKEDYFAGQPLAKVIGKSLTEKILAVQDWQRFDSEDLHIGAEGMNTFYDTMLVNFMDKYGRQWDVKTEDVEMRHLDITGRMHSVAVTPQMRDDVRKGQPMFFLDGSRQAYGFTYDGEVYVDRRVATAETPIHEYTHLWAEVLRQRNPKEWENIVSLMKGCPELWKEVTGRYAHLHDESDIAEEVLAHYSGQRGYQRLMADYGRRQDVTGHSILDILSEALARLWKTVADFLHIHYTTKEQVADQVLSDLLNRVNPLDYKTEVISAGAVLSGRITEDVVRAMSEQGTRFETLHSLHDRADYLTFGEVKDYNGKPFVDVISHYPNGRAARLSSPLDSEMHYLNDEVIKMTVKDGLILRLPPSGAYRESQEEQVESAYFKEWFGDWQHDPEKASKVVDADGRPLVVEHGTHASFTEFDISRLGQNSGDAGLYGAGFYFGTKAPGWLEAPVTMKVYLDMKHPFEIDAGIQRNIYDYLKEHFDQPALRKLVLTENGKELTLGDYIDHIKAVDNLVSGNMPYVEEQMSKDAELQYYKPDARLDVWREHELSRRTGFIIPGSLPYVIGEMIGSENFTIGLKEDGYDGVIATHHYDDGHDYKDYVVFEPGQVKSATDNVGLFSKKSNDIRYHLSGEEVYTTGMKEGTQPSVSSRHLTPQDREAGGALVDHLARMGITVHTDNNENRRILKAARLDNSEAGKVRHFKTQDGNTYGFAYKGQLHLDLRKIDAELPLHEYAHLWCEALRRINPENWNRVVSMLRDDAASWQFVRAAYPELQDADDVAEEVIAHYSGRRGAEKLRDELARMTPRDANYGSRWGNIFQNVSKAIQDFWKHVGDSLNIQYVSAEDVYDQILNDFAKKVNPVAKVEKYLKERDRIYEQCVEGGDLDTAAAMFEEALQEHVGGGVTPFMAVDGYRGKLDRLARDVKGGSDDAIRRAAGLMAPLVPVYSVLVPAPGHEGYATDMLALANAISQETGAPVADVLKGNPRERQYDVKKATGKPMSADAMGIRMEGVLPQGYMPVVIDNVVHSGNTAEACVRALGKGVVLSLASAVSQERHVSSLKSLEPVVYDKDGVLIPLSERFNLKSRYLGRAMEYRPLDEGLHVAEPLTIDIRTGNSHSPLDSYLGSKAVYDAVLSLSGSRDKLVAGYEDPDSGDYVFVGTHAHVMRSYDKEHLGSFSQHDGHDAVYRIHLSDGSLYPVSILSASLVHDGYNLAVIGKEKVRELMDSKGHATLQSLSRPVVRSAVQLDLFRDAPAMEESTEAAAVHASQGSTEDTSLDLTALHLRDLADGEQCFVERRYRENGFFSFVGGESIDSAEDVAFIFRSLEDQSVENSFLAMVKDGKPLVIHLGIGTYSEVPAPIEKALVAFNELKPDKVWFVHNHPSGSLKASFLDMKMHQRMQEVFGAAVQPSIIINTTSGKYGEYTDVYSVDLPLSGNEESHMVSVPTFQFDRQVFSKGWNPEHSMMASSAASIAGFVSSQRLGERDKLSLIVFDQAQHITGNVFIPWNTTKAIVKGGHAGELAGYVHQMGGNRCIIYGSEDGVRMTDTETMTMLSKQLKSFGVRLEDIMSVSRSAFQEGIFYAKEEDRGYSMAGEAVIDETVRPIQGLENYSEAEIQKLVREYFGSMLEGTDVDVEIVGMKVIGSRMEGTGTADSDLDVLLEYKGDFSEDSLFNILNDADDRLYIEGIPVDINPITEGRSGTIREFLERNAGYRKAEPVDNDTAKKTMKHDENDMYVEPKKSSHRDLDATVRQLLSRDDSFRYQMLDRLRVDCNYFLGHGGRYEGSLWAGNVNDHIAVMKELWKSLPEKPEWLTMEQIDAYARDMGAGLDSAVEHYSDEQSAIVKDAICDYLQGIRDDYYPHAMMESAEIDMAVHHEDVRSTEDAARVAHKVSVEILLRAESVEPGIVERYTGESLGTEARRMASDATAYASTVLYNREHDMERKLEEKVSVLNIALKTARPSDLRAIGMNATLYSIEKKDDAHFALIEHDGDDTRFATRWISAVAVEGHMDVILGAVTETQQKEIAADEYIRQEFQEHLDSLRDILGEARDMIADKITIRPVTIELGGESATVEQIEEINGKYLAGNSQDLLSDLCSYRDVTELATAVREAQIAHLLGNGQIDFVKRAGSPQKFVNDTLTNEMAYIRDISCHEGRVSINGAIDMDGTPGYVVGLKDLQPDGIRHLLEEVRKVVEWKPELNLTTDQALMVAEAHHLYDEVEQDIKGGLEPELALQKYHIMPDEESLAEIIQMNDPTQLPPVDAVRLLLDKAIPNDGDVLHLDGSDAPIDLQYQSFGWQQLDDVKYIRHIGDGYVAGNGEMSIDVSRLAAGPDGDYLVNIINDNIKLMEDKTMEEKKQEVAQVQQELQPEQKKKGWNIDYTKYSMPEGVSVEKAQVFKLTRGENEGRWAVTAVVDGQRKTQVMFKNDVDAFFEKDEQGQLKPTNPTAEQLVAKYFAPKAQEQAAAVQEEQGQQAQQQEPEQQEVQATQDAGKRKGWNIDYTKYSMPEGVNVEKAQVFKMDQGDNAGKYAISAVIDGQRKTQVMFKNDVDAYFSKDEQGNRKATAEQLVAKYFSPNTQKQPIPVKEERQEQRAGEQQEAQAKQDDGKRKGWNIDYSKYSMPEGAVVSNSFVKKDDKSGKYRLFATINGEFRSADLYPNDRQAFFEKNEAGERKATTEQLVAKYFSKSTAEKMGLASVAEQPRQETKHLGTYDVPVWAVAALQNGTDAYDGLQEDEISEIEHFQEQFDGPLSFDVHMEDRNEFNPSPAFGAACETVKVDVYTFVEKVSRAQAEVRENLEEDKVAEDINKEHEEKKQEEQKKEGKQDVSAGLALQTALLVGALHAAAERDGVWMNRLCKQAPAFMGKDTKITPFNSMVMALHSDANGYKSNLYTTFAAAKNDGVSVRGKEKGLPYNWYDWDKYVNKYVNNDVIDRAAYQALPQEERELYRVQGKKEMKPIFNIDQTTLPMEKKEEYKTLVGAVDQETQEEMSPAEKQAARQERFAEMTEKYPDSVKLFRVDDGYEIYGEDAEKAADILSLPLVKEKDGDANVLSTSVSFPMEDLDSYIPILVHEGTKIAICDDLEDADLRRHTPEAELYAASDKLVEAIRLTGVDIDSNGVTRYDAGKNTLYVADRTQTKPGQEMTLAIDRACDVYRAAVAYTGTEDRLNRGQRERMLPEDRDKYDRLVQELTAGVMMARQGLPATISEKNRELVPYWERELKEDPKLLDSVERDVNNAVQVLDKVAAGQQVDYAAMRGERPAVMTRPRMYTIASELATIPSTEHKQAVIVKDEKAKAASVILPSGASSEMNNEIPGMNKNRYVVALKREGFDDVKFYNAGGALGLNQPNEFFADKQVEVAHLKQYELITDERIDLSAELARTSQVEIEKVTAIRNDKEDWVFYVKPAEGEAVTIMPDAADLHRFFNAVKDENFDDVRQEMGRKYYALAQQFPHLKQDFIMPKVENVDLSRISYATMFKSKFHEGKACVTCVYDDGKKLATEIDRGSKEWQRLWLVDDQKGYKIAVAAKLFENELNKGQEKNVVQAQDEPVKETEVVTVDDDQEEVEEEQQVARPSFHR